MPATPVQVDSGEGAIEEEDVDINDEAPEDLYTAFIATLSRKVQQNLEKPSTRVILPSKRDAIKTMRRQVSALPQRPRNTI